MHSMTASSISTEVGEVLASMHDAVADGADLVETIENLPIPSQRTRVISSAATVWSGISGRRSALQPVPAGDGEPRHGRQFQPDPLDEAGSERFLCVCLE